MTRGDTYHPVHDSSLYQVRRLQLFEQILRTWEAKGRFFLHEAEFRFNVRTLLIIGGVCACRYIKTCHLPPTIPIATYQARLRDVVVQVGSSDGDPRANETVAAARSRDESIRTMMILVRLV